MIDERLRIKKDRLKIKMNKKKKDMVGIKPQITW